MQVVILCGGMGTRIRDVADDVPKPMIPIGGRPILWHIMKRYADYGFRRFILCLGYRSWSIKQFFLDYPYAQADLTLRLGAMEQAEARNKLDVEGWEVTLAETGLETMTGGRIKAVERYIDSDDFHVTYGDGVADVDLHALTEFHRHQGRLGTVTTVKAPGRFGEISLHGRLVAAFREKPPSAPGWINGGFFVFRREFLDRLPDRPDTVLEQVPLQDLACDGQLAAYPHEGFWHCMDNSRDYQHLNHLYQHGQAAWLKHVAAPAIRAAA